MKVVVDTRYLVNFLTSEIYVSVASEWPKQDWIQRVGTDGSRLYRQVVARIRSADPHETIPAVLRGPGAY